MKARAEVGGRVLDHSGIESDGRRRDRQVGTWLGGSTYRVGFGLHEHGRVVTRGQAWRNGGDARLGRHLGGVREVHDLLRLGARGRRVVPAVPKAWGGNQRIVQLRNYGVHYFRLIVVRDAGFCWLRGGGGKGGMGVRTLTKRHKTPSPHPYRVVSGRGEQARRRKTGTRCNHPPP